MDRFALIGGSAEFVDESHEPRFVVGIAPLDLELHELTTIPDDSGDHAITLGLEGGARLKWSGRQTIEPLRFEGKVEIAGIHLSRVWEYLQPTNPLEVHQGLLDLTCSYDLRRGQDGAFALALKDAGLTVRELAMRPRDGAEDWLTVPLVEVRGAQAFWPESRAEVREVRVTAPRALAWIDTDGTVNWQAAIAALGTRPAAASAASGPPASAAGATATTTPASTAPAPPAPSPPAAAPSPPAPASTSTPSANSRSGGSRAPTAPATSSSAAAAGPGPWTVKVGSVDVVEASAHFEDRTFDPKIVVDLTDAGLHLDNVTSDLKAPIPARLSARINGAGEAEASGTVVLEPPRADLQVKLRGLELAPFNSYAIHLPWASIRRGAAGAEGRVRVGTGSPGIQFDGSLEIAELQVAGGGIDRLVACDRATASGASITIFPERIRVAKVQLDGAFVKLDIDREGVINLKKIFVDQATPPAAPGSSPSAAAAAAPAAATPKPAAPAPPSEPLYLDIGFAAIRNATAEYTDESLILPFGTKIHSINGSIQDLSTTAPAAARLALEGRISETGYFKSDGTLRIAAPFASTDIGVIFRGVRMPELTPYSAQFAGYSIAKGTLDVDVRYRIQDGRLVGDHRVVAKDLTLGPKVEGAPAPGLPVRLAIALLKDKDGRIDLEVPVEGTIDSPEFNYRSVFWQAFKKILGNIVKAPFRAIGRLFGADQEELELVGFPSGQSDLPAPEQEKLAKLGAELSRKPEISLEIEGRFDPLTDVEAIRRARLEQRIESRREGAPGLEAILESLYSETFSPGRLEAERQKFQPGAAAPAPAAEEPKKKRKKKEPPPPPPPPKEAFDAAGFYDALRSQLLAAEEVTEGALGDLARARAAAIATALAAPGGLDPSRVKTLDPAPVKRKKQGSELVASEMTLSAGD